VYCTYSPIFPITVLYIEISKFLYTISPSIQKIHFIRTYFEKHFLLRFIYLFERERACAHMLVGGGTQRENPQVDSQLSAQSDVGLGPMIRGIVTGAETRSRCFN